MREYLVPKDGLPEAVNDALHKLVDLRRQEREAGQFLYDLNAQREAVTDQDGDELADAILANKKTPGQKRLKKYLDDVNDATYRASGYKKAVEKQTVEALRAIDHHRLAITNTADERVASAQSFYRAAVEALASSYESLQESYALRAWIQAFDLTSPRLKGDYSATGSLKPLSVATANGVPLSLDVAIEHLRQVIPTPPVEVAVAVEAIDTPEKVNA